LRAAVARDLLSVSGRVPRGMKAKPSTAGHTDALTWNYTKNHGAGRKAGPIDDHTLAGIAQRH
jgi:hypothetical protein